LDGIDALREAFPEIYEKVMVVAADLRTVVGRRYSMMLGVDSSETSRLPQIRLIVRS
jgi:hypothetical protein